MDLKKTLDESLDGMWGNRSYGGTSELPRKDYQPYSASSGYSYPYQAGGNAMLPPSDNGPENTPSIPWPMANLSEDLADGFVYILSAVRKMQRALKENPSLTKKQKKVISKYIKALKISLIIVKRVGMSIIKTVNLAGPLPAQMPQTLQSVREK